MPDEIEKFDGGGVVSLTSDIVAAYISHNPVPRAELPALITDVHAAVERLRTSAVKEPEVKLTPAVSVKRSVTPDYIVCLEDGKKFKSLKRHLTTHYNLSPAEYREKWGLPRDYPMVAPAYAAARSSLAKSMGLGRKRTEVAPAPPPVEAKPKRGRAPRKAAVAAVETPMTKPAGRTTRKKKADA